MGKGYREKIKTTGDKLIETIRELIREGTVRHVVIKNEEGRTLIEFPVAIGVAGAVLIPVWAAIGAIAAVVSDCTIEIERTDDEEGEEDSEAEASADEEEVVEAEVVEAEVE